jgi:hypothetical protein
MSLLSTTALYGMERASAQEADAPATRSSGSGDMEPMKISGFIENATYLRKGVGLSKARNTAQFEFDKTWRDAGMFSDFSFHMTLRGTYDAVYDLNKDTYGKNAGGPILLESPGGSGWAAHGSGDITTGTLDGPLPGNQFGFNVAANPNQGLEVLGNRLHGQDGGVAFGVPVRPCNIDPRGCIAGYLDNSLDNLRFPEFNSRLDFLREAYIDGNIPVGGDQQLHVRLGRQQVVWGRTDLFRVLDVINPIDYSRNNIYDELQDIRIPQWILQTEYKMAATGPFDDLNFSVVWNFDKFRPSNLGQGGTPNEILDAGSFFRGMKNCWDNGCTVANFAGGAIATDFGPHQIGIRQANLPNWSLKNTQIGGKIEGLYQGVGFSLNYLNYIAQLPTLRGGIPAVNAFTGQQAVWPYLIAFDIDFPRVNLYGGSVDFYVDSIKSVFRVEAAYTTGEEFADTLQPRLFKKSRVLRYVIGWDRDTFIPFLNKNKAFLISAQLFGQHLLDHELQETPGSLANIPGFGPAGMPDWKENWIATLLIKGFYKQNTLSPQLLSAYDFKGHEAVISPSLDWLITDNWQITAAANFKFGRGAQKFDDCRTCNPWPPFTSTPLHADPFAPGSVGLGGFEPLGRFRQGPIGSADKEDEIQLTVRYRF